MGSLPIFIFIFMLLTVVVLALGLVSMVTGGKFDEKYSTKLMSLRVLFQAVTIALVALMFLLK